MTPEEIIFLEETILHILQDPELAKRLNESPVMSVHLVYIIIMMVGGIGIAFGRIWRFHKEISDYRKDVSEKLSILIDIAKENLSLQRKKV